MIVTFLLGCAPDADTTTGSDDQAPLSVCVLDGELPVDLPGGGALDVLDRSEALAAELLGADPIWRGDLRGLVVDLDGRPTGDGQIPGTVDGEGVLVRTGWTTTWCAGEREVTISAGLTEAFAVCGPSATCGDDPDERPLVDADQALQTVDPVDPGFLYLWLYQSGETSDTPFWQVVWHGDAGQLFALVDARTSEILACRDGGPDTCRDLTTLD